MIHQQEIHQLTIIKFSKLKKKNLMNLSEFKKTKTKTQTNKKLLLFPVKTLRYK